MGQVYQVSLPAILLPILFLAGCAPPAPPPMVSLDGRSCGAQVDLSSGHVPALEVSKAIMVTLDEKAMCLQAPDGSKSVYAAFLLPQLPALPLVTVMSSPLGEGLFSPHLLMLDPEGKILREVPRDAFSFHGSALHVGIRMHAEERYLLVASDPQTVGTDISRIVDGTTTSTTTTYFKGGGSISSSASFGKEDTLKLTYAHNGTVSVLVQPMPKAD